ncbi:MAG: glycine cleavage system aminomethyltransferase GcvT [Aestuariivirga sp.]|uniref:glycine cleavage system aminomethyltransferase GcvT n=1 Tax=Aestuariivirga sp. TaxID=2650926 RepID=UPI0025C32F79|nr:glycine cleavage system aminomethyltransferase GcvT [Aestuariivirga sp.]MCA3559447.1 glycine cleavage system aminomethyltransferase GcvT [Aestuariivirga sp.]
MSDDAPKRTSLYDDHVKLGARMVPFVGYDMPVQYPAGILAEHNWTRQNAGLFDVSHMGQCLIAGKNFETVAKAMEALVPADVLSLKPRQQRYSQFLNEEGGTLDDLMITRHVKDGTLYVVVNAGRKEHDYGWMQQHLAEGVTLTRRDDLSLVALQGPKAEEALAKLAPAVKDIPFMHYADAGIGGIKAQVSRSGYTGEDGFEISVANADAPKLWNLLLSDPLVKPVGLGARDSLRLEGGLCLYGHELDETISPVEADLVWSIQKRRRAQGGFIGAARVQKELANGTARKRVGIRPEGRAPARDGAVITDSAGREIGKVTSGGFGPSVGGPIAMGYVETASAVPGTKINLVVRGTAMPAAIVSLPFIPNRFKR